MRLATTTGDLAPYFSDRSAALAAAVREADPFSDQSAALAAARALFPRTSQRRCDWDAPQERRAAAKTTASAADQVATRSPNPLWEKSQVATPSGA